METRPLQDIPPDLAGTDLDGYHLVELIGLGGMGSVYRAQASDTGEMVALKLISSQIALDPVHRRRFEREMAVTEHLIHSNILPVLYVGRQPDRLYMVMPYVAGGSLDRLLDDHNCLPPVFAARLATQIGAALDVAHDHDIVHRDVKPANILLLDKHRVALADFGLAKVVDGLATQLTESGTVVGTPAYMSPEQALGYPLDGRTDIYSLAMVLYRCLVGRLPFSAESAMAMINQQINMLPIAPTDINPAFPLDVERVLLTALAKNRDDRYSSAGAFAQALAAALQGVEPAVFETGVLVSDQQIAASRDITPGRTPQAMVFTPGPYHVNASTGGDDTTINLALEETVETPRRFGIGWIVMALVLLIGGLWLGYRLVVAPLQQRAVFAEQTASALARQTPIVITQIVTNDVGQIIVIESTRLVTAFPEGFVPTDTATPRLAASATATPGPTATASRTPTRVPPTDTPRPPTDTPRPPTATSRPPTSTPAPTATRVLPTRTPLPADTGPVIAPTDKPSSVDPTSNDGDITVKTVEPQGNVLPNETRP